MRGELAPPVRCGIKLCLLGMKVPALSEGMTANSDGLYIVVSDRDGKQYLIQLDPNQLLPVIPRDNSERITNAFTGEVSKIKRGPAFQVDTQNPIPF